MPTFSPATRAAQIAAVIDAEVARAMTPYRRLNLPADELDELEKILRFGLATHPTAQALIRQLVADPVVATSETLDTAEVDRAIKKGQGA